MVKVEVKNKGKIGFQEINGTVFSDRIITINDRIDFDNKQIWTIGSSRTFYSDIDLARMQNECITEAFKELDKLNG